MSSAIASLMAPVGKFRRKFLCPQLHWRCSVRFIIGFLYSPQAIPFQFRYFSRSSRWRTCRDLVGKDYRIILSPHAINFRSSYIVTIVFMMITAAVLAEICSALPLSGSIYIWAAESAGPKYARFFGFIVAWWSCTAWMTFTAGNCQVRQSFLNPCLLIKVRLPPITSFRNLQCGKWSFQEASPTKT